MKNYFKFITYNLLVLVILFTSTKAFDDKKITEYKSYYSEKRNETLDRGISMEEYSQLIKKSKKFRETLNTGQSKRIGEKILLDTSILVIGFLAFIVAGYISTIPFMIYNSITTFSIVIGGIIFGYNFIIPAIIGYLIGLFLGKNRLRGQST